ncbi:MAG: serine/threonine-protein kinase [Myxococcota bacterium]
MIGLRIGNYQITEKIGEGGAGEVFRATDVMLEREVAIKVLRPELASSPELVRRFRIEARTLAQLSHVNIATLYAMLREEKVLVMVMEFVDGQSVTELLRDSGPMGVETCLPLFLQALDGIGYAHERGVIHRDIKSSNLMLSRAGVVKVMDFGISRCLGTSRLTRDGLIVGTPHYMSPEQIRGDDTDARSDIYSLGILLFEMVTGELPFDHTREYELIRAQIEDPPPRPHDLVEDVPEILERAVLCALAKEPENRFASTREFRGALEQVLPVDLHLTGDLELGAGSSLAQDFDGSDPTLIDATPPGQLAVYPRQSDVPTTELDSSKHRRATTALRTGPLGRRRGSRALLWGAAAGVVGLLVLGALGQLGIPLDLEWSVYPAEPVRVALPGEPIASARVARVEPEVYAPAVHGYAIRDPFAGRPMARRRADAPPPRAVAPAIKKPARPASEISKPARKAPRPESRSAGERAKREPVKNDGGGSGWVMNAPGADDTPSSGAPPAQHPAATPERESDRLEEDAWSIDRR